jgi:TrmH family RNA methyltransferase
MLSKNKIKFIRSLHHKKNRQHEKNYLAEGEKIVGELLASGHEPLLLAAEEAWLTTHKLPSSCEHYTCSEKELKAAGTLHTPNAVLAVFPIPEAETDINTLQNQTCLLLDKINDPGNLGTIIRCADWFGMPNIICSDKSTDAWGPKAVQASMGSIARVEVFYAGLKELLSGAVNVPVYGAYMQGHDIGRSQMENPCWLLFGSESHGISRELEVFINKKLSIPSHHTGPHRAESLNMAMSAAIACHEFRRQHPSAG